MTTATSGSSKRRATRRIATGMGVPRSTVAGSRYPSLRRPAWPPPPNLAWPPAWPGWRHLLASVRISLQWRGSRAASVAKPSIARIRCEKAQCAARTCNERPRRVECPIGFEPTTFSLGSCGRRRVPQRFPGSSPIPCLREQTRRHAGTTSCWRRECYVRDACAAANSPQTAGNLEACPLHVPGQRPPALSRTRRIRPECRGS